MARPKDPVEDVLWVAAHLDSCVVLMRKNISVDDIIEGLSLRLYQDVDLIREGKEVPQ